MIARFIIVHIWVGQKHILDVISTLTLQGKLFWASVSLFVRQGDFKL